MGTLHEPHDEALAQSDADIANPASASIAIPTASRAPSMNLGLGRAPSLGTSWPPHNSTPISAAVPCISLPKVATSLQTRRSHDIPCKGETKADIGTWSLAANRYAGLNQDYLVVQELYTPGEVPPGGQTTVLAICDGHGILGDKSSCFAGKALARHVYSSGLRNRNLARIESALVRDEMKAAFHKAHQSANMVYDMPPKVVSYPMKPGAAKTTEFTLTDAHGMKVYRSGKGTEKMLECGTTCTAAIMQGRFLCVANVGDSQAVLGSTSSTGSAFQAEVVTVRHHGQLASEADRIRTFHSDTTQILEDGYIKALCGPWAGYELAVTRALGHLNMEAYGVIDDPHVAFWSVTPEHCCLILASDGLWDVLSPEQAVEHVMASRARGNNATAAARALVELAVQQGLEQFEEQDNTSAIVVFFGSAVPTVAGLASGGAHANGAHSRFASP